MESCFMEAEKIKWRNRVLREDVAVIDGKLAPTLLLKNSTYLNTFTKKWVKAHIWIYKEKIVYVGDQLPENNRGMEILDCEGKFLVPGYIEPHAHPFQLYNPEALAIHAAKFGTTTLINDNLMLNFLLDKKKAFTLLEESDNLQTSMFWWARYDSQSALKNEELYFNTDEVLAWLSHPLVVQGGELTSWPRLLHGDDRLLYWIQETKRLGKPVEGHFPGASETTLTKMKLFGIDADHESMTGEEVLKRLELGYHVGLRHSSIRPDLPKLITEILAEGIETFDQFTLTTDGSTPAFYENGLMNVCVEIAIENGIPIEEAYRMVSYNVAQHYGLTEHGSIVPGCIANINILKEKTNPHPASVIVKGKVFIKEGVSQAEQTIDWDENGVSELVLDWDLTQSDLQFSLPIGLEMYNDVILKPCTIQTDMAVDDIPPGKEDAFLLFIDRHGEWRVNTTIRGFTNRLGALVSSYSTTGDIVIIGKNKPDMLIAWKRMKELGGGIVLVHDEEIIFELPLKIGGIMYHGNMEELIEKEKDLKDILKDFGYRYDDPVYNILFLSAIHLPYIRVTQQGVMDVMKREIIFPSIMR